MPLFWRPGLRWMENGACWLTPSMALCFSCKIMCTEKKRSSTLLSHGSVLHGLIWSMVSMSPRPHWDLRSHQAHTFERHLFIFRMQMQPTSKAISCREHTMCWSAPPGGWGPTYVRFRPLPPPTWTPAATHKHISLKRPTAATEGLSSHRTDVYPFCCVIYKGFNGGHLHKVCRRLRCSMCHMKAALRRARSNNAKSPPPALLSPAPFGTLPCPPVSGFKEGGEGGGGTREG